LEQERRIQGNPNGMVTMSPGLLRRLPVEALGDSKSVKMTLCMR
jgi:hypothetical protein